jgi:hypothetical protein
METRNFIGHRNWLHSVIKSLFVKLLKSSPFFVKTSDASPDEMAYSRFRQMQVRTKWDTEGFAIWTSVASSDEIGYITFRQLDVRCKS